MEPFKLLAKAKDILDRTDDFSKFEEKYSQNLRMHGERMVDGAVFVFDLKEGYSLLVFFSDYSFDYFSIIHKSLNGDILQYV